LRPSEKTTDGIRTITKDARAAVLTASEEKARSTGHGTIEAEHRFLRS
jgi:hypothetical protein